VFFRVGQPYSEVKMIPKIEKYWD